MIAVRAIHHRDVAMAKIFYSMAGEGRGHAARVRTLVEHLRDEHELWLFASDDAYEFLSRCYGPAAALPTVRLVRIPGLRFHYTHGRLDLTKSVLNGLGYAFSALPRLVRAFRRRIEAVRPDLIVTDFEPALARAAAAERVPLLSLDHQHVLLTYDLSSLPTGLQWYAWLMGFAVRWHTPRPSQIVASSFYSPPLKRGWSGVRQIGPMIRPEVAAAEPTTGDYLLSYLRSATPSRVLDVLAQAGLPVKVYGLGERPAAGPLTFCPIHEQRFVDDLAGCQAVVCAAGNQLLGESLYFGKPVLALPEQHHHEQLINAYFIAQLGVGMWTALERFGVDDLTSFVSQMDVYRTEAQRLQGRLDGTADALSCIRGLLPAEHSEPVLRAG